MIPDSKHGEADVEIVMRAILKKWNSVKSAQGHPDIEWAELAARASLAAAPAAPTTERDAALEEAAKVADNWLKQYADRSPEFVSAQKWACDAVADIADAIRALRTTAPGTVGTKEIEDMNFGTMKDNLIAPATGEGDGEKK